MEYPQMSGKSKKDKSQVKLKRARHYFFLNPYGDMAFTKDPLNAPQFY